MTTPTQTTALWRRALRAGPGMGGQRDPLTAEDRQSLSEELIANGLEAPTWLASPCEWVDRPAKLFEAGEFPDKGVTITPDDLASLAARFTDPVPVLIEHAEAPLEMGWLTAVEARGGELFGTVSLTAQASQLVDQSQAHALSLGLSRDLAAIREVSLVRRPRILSARLFADGLVFWGGLQGNLEQRCRELELQLSEHQSAARIAELVGQGRLTPAQAPIFRRLMQCGKTLEFDGESVAVSRLVEQLIELVPPHGLFTEIAPFHAAPESELTPEQADFYARRFPDLELSEIAKHLS